MARGKKILTPVHHAAIKRVREQYASYVLVGVEVQQKIEELEQAMRSGAEGSLRAAIFAALDAGVPQTYLKEIVEVKNHDTFKSRWIDSYTPPAPPLFSTRWFSLHEADGWTLVRFVDAAGTELYVRAGETQAAPVWREDAQQRIENDSELVAWVESQDKGNELLDAIFIHATKG